MSQYVIETASPQSLPAALALIAPVNHPDSIVLTARDVNGVLAGAAGILWQSWGRPPGFPCWVHVLPDVRRGGIGTALVREMIERATGETAGLWGARALVEDSPAHHFACSLGFEKVGKQLVFKANSGRFLAETSRIIERLRRGNRIPANAEARSLTKEILPTLAPLLLAELDTVPRDIERQMLVSLDGDPATSPVDCNRSRVLHWNGEVIGALLSRRLPDGSSSAIICNVVAPQYRRGWANALLLESTTRAGVDDGCPQFQFDCADTHRDTIGLARRCDAELVRTESLFRYALTAAGRA